jgi:Phage portal protein, SPP1 Gp6-like
VTAVPTVGTPEWWLDRLGRRLTERAGRAVYTRVGRRDDTGSDRRLVDATGMALYQAYYEGRHRETYKIRRVIEAFGLRMPIYVNYAGVVVDSISERLGVDGFTFGGDDRASEAAWAIWQDNNLDAGFKRGMRSGLIKGEFSLVLWPDEQWSPRIWVEDGAEVITSVHPETGLRRAALKRWADEDEPGAMFATLFLPTAVYKYRTPATANTAGAELATVGGTVWERRAVPGEPWPLPNPLGVVPVIPFPNKPDLHLAGESELGKVVPIQDAINANIANVMLAGLYGAFRQKVMLNLALEVDPATGAPIQPFDVALDSLITVPPNAPGEPEPRLAEFSQTDLAGYIAVHETLVQAIATASRFPPHYLLGTQGTFPSGESLTAVERGISAVAGERGDDWKDPLEDAMRLAFAIKARAPGNSAAATARFEKWAAMTGAEAAFRNPETKSESQHVDAVTKKKDLDVPRRQLWSELGYSQQQVLDWEADLAAAPPEPAQPVVPLPVPGTYIPGPIDSTGGAQPPS